jgi:RNA-binding protein NOB1
MATETPKPIHSLVLDAGPIIKNEPSVSTMLGQAETLYTIPAVIDEIRDAVTRARIENTLLPFLNLRSPRLASVKVISDFARKTGDLEVLSRPDIHLMALAYELECERNHGDWRLRSTPGQKGLNGVKPEPLNDVAPQETGAEVKSDQGESEEDRAAPPKTRGAWGTTIPTAEDSSTITETNNNLLVEEFEATHIAPPEPTETKDPVETENSEATAEGVPSSESLVAGTQAHTSGETESAIPLSDALVEEVEASESEGSDGEGWITPSNLKKHQEKDANGSAKPSKEPQTMQVALITSDFAMQNVLLRMNLNLLSPSLQRIRQLKNWVLRCHACFYITKDMTKQFCSRCGKPTLLRTSCSTDKDGNFKVHLKKNMQWNTRGNVYSIPKPVAGTSNGKLVAGGGKGGWGQSLILAEDQKEYIQAMTGVRRNKEKDLMDEDYLPNLLSGDRGRAGGRPKIGAGKNVNSKKRR